MRQGRECIDDWLAQRNLWRKQVARDDISLYRAVSDQLFPIDGCPDKMRQQVEQYIRIHAHEFKSQITCRIEYLAICNIYKCSIVIFRCNKAPVEVAFDDAWRKVLLCINSSQRYDPVYPLARRDHSAICQSIVYEILYKDVFEVSDETVELGLEILRAKVSKKAKLQLLERMQKPGGEEQMIRTDDGRLLPSHPPFPYRVAKALDASIFRNVQFDLWIDKMKENRDIPTFHVGDRCKVVLGSGIYNAHIQDIRTSTGPVQVFIQEFGERLDVPYDAMRPIPAAQQMPRRTKRNSRSYSFHTNTIFGSVTERGSEDPVYSVALFKSRPRQYLNSTGHPIRVRWSPTKSTRTTREYAMKTTQFAVGSAPVQTAESDAKNPVIEMPLSMDGLQISQPPPLYDPFMTPNPLCYQPAPEMVDQLAFPGMEYSQENSCIPAMPNVAPELMPQTLMRPPPLGQTTYYCLPNPGMIPPMYYPGVYSAPEQFFVMMPQEPVEFNPHIPPPPVMQQVYLP